MVCLLSELARLSGAELQGDGDCQITGVGQLQSAGQGDISFLANSHYGKYLRVTRASAVILAPEMADQCPVNALISTNPYLCYARVAGILFPAPLTAAGVHAAAVVDGSASVHRTACVAACAVVEANAVIERDVYVGPGCVVGAGCHLGEGTRLVANVTLCSGTQIGRRVLVHPGVVIGGDGFGFANDRGSWVKIPQLGRVRIGDDVEIGANTAIDRGTIGDTVIENGVKLDNQIMIAHNVTIGENTAIAGCAGISGSTRVGRRCTIGGGVGLAGHLEIGDDVHFSGQSLVTKSFPKSGHYSGNLPAVETREWRRSVANIRRLDELVRRIKALERLVHEKGSETK
ncbi:MAG: UDP-3-O-(3-hydroxymyristoyl)glucosamine N-acyltransferase [Gammaproteobacteria bacterium]|nr:UDP-3-O-(3-hydroxymyristoyl)glucosamine N-acyltransferase [Gammaproteobacteria bacterium]